MPTVKIRDKYFKYNGVKYFRTRSQAVVLGTCGHKLRPLGKANYVENFLNMSTRYFTDIIAQAVEIDYADSPAFSLGFDVKVPGIGSIGGDLSREVMRDMDLKLLNVSVGSGQVIDSINNLDEVKNGFFKLDRNGWKKRRIVSEVFTVVSAEIAETLTTSSSSQISGTIKGVEIELSPTTSNTQSSTIKLDAGTTFAYLLFKPRWNAVRYKNIETVVGGKLDQWGFG